MRDLTSSGLRSKSCKRAPTSWCTKARTGVTGVPVTVMHVSRAVEVSEGGPFVRGVAVFITS